MGEKPGKPGKKKGLSAHQAGQLAPHTKAKYDPDAPGTPVEGLTAREEELLSLVAEDKKNKEIAKELNIKVPTVEKHIENIYRKIGVKSRASAAIWLIQSKLDAALAENAVLKEIIAKQLGSSAAQSS
jgi:DNA-binding NarL/FixJ family response regulator